MFVFVYSSPNSNKLKFNNLITVLNYYFLNFYIKF